MIGILGHKGCGIIPRRIVEECIVAKEAAAKIAGPEVMEKFSQELKLASERLSGVEECAYLARGGKAFVKVNLTNSYVHHGTFELSDDGLSQLQALVNYVATDESHECNDEFAY